MTPGQQAALESLKGHALTVDQVARIDALLPSRDDIGVALILSEGLVLLTTRMISARGVRECLSVTDAVRLLNLFKSTAASFEVDPTAVPAWLSAVLTTVGIPLDQHADYFDTVACAHEWLQGDGIDMGASRPRGVLDMIALSDPPTFVTTVATLKSLGQRSNSIPYTEVSAALNGAE